MYCGRHLAGNDEAGLVCPQGSLSWRPAAPIREAAQPNVPMKRIAMATLVTLILILWAHQLPTIGGRVPMVFVALWFGSATMVAMIFSMKDVNPSSGQSLPHPVARQWLWRHKLRMAGFCLLPLTLVPLLETRGVANDPAVWLLDSALLISLFTVPYFTLVARTFAGGAILSVGAFQALWTSGASALFVVMKHSAAARGAPLAQGGNFEDFFKPEYRYLFYILCAVMVLGYSPALLWLGHRRFLRQAGPDIAPDSTGTAVADAASS